LLHAHVYELSRLANVFQEAPALHPVERALQLVGRDRRRVDQINPAFAQIVDRELGNLGVLVLIIVDEVVEVGACWR
jgi:hypothetical protein